MQKDLLPSMTRLQTQLRWVAEHRAAIMQGGVMDALAAIGFATILTAMPRRLRWIGLGAIVAFCAANIEHVKYNYANIDLRSLGMAVDPTFLRGSIGADAVAYAGALCLVAVVGLALVQIGWLRRATLALVGGGMAAILAAGPPPSPQSAAWMQTNPLLPVQFASTGPEDPAAPAFAALEPSPVEAAPESRYNLLVVYIEGLSTTSMERGNMVAFQSIARRGIRFETYVGRQIITANGLYATLTGYAPSLLQRMSKWDALTDDSRVARTALPRRLTERGYHTAFLQAADLAYMDKDQHLATLGFDVRRGDADWPAARSRNGWGIDDMTLVDNTLSYLDGLKDDTPWFVSVLTSGTHSPYNVPGRSAPTRGEALRAADAAVAALVAGLEARGLLETTTVVLTSDEGREVEVDAGFLNDLTLNRLPLVVLHPDLGDLTIQTPLMNSDFPNLAMTLTGALADGALETSLPKHMDLVFGNVITGKVFWFDVADRVLTGCTVVTFDCLRWKDRTHPFDTTGETGVPVHLSRFAALAEWHDGNDTTRNNPTLHR